MAKKTVSFSLEEDLIGIIDEVRKEKNLSSRSAALERILLSRQIYKDEIRKTIIEVLGERKLSDNDIVNSEKSIDEVEKSINDAFDSMPE